MTEWIAKQSLKGAFTLLVTIVITLIGGSCVNINKG